MCMSEGTPITYEQIMPPEARRFRDELYQYIQGNNNLYAQGVPQYPGKIPFTGPPSDPQILAMDTMMRLLGGGGYNPYNTPTVPPANIYPNATIPKPDPDRFRDDPYAPYRGRRDNGGKWG